MGRFRPLRSNGGVQVAVVMPIVFGVPAPDAVVDLDPPRRPAKKQKREAMPPEYVKPLGKPGQLHPHWRKSFPDDEEDADGRGKVVEGLPGYGIWRRVPGFWKILASDLGYIMTEGGLCVREVTPRHDHYLRVTCNGNPESVHMLVCRAFKGRPTSDQVSVDHKDRDESNNCKDNLRWATWAEQMYNTGKRKVYSNGEPCVVWQVKGDKLKGKGSPRDTTPVVGAAQRFPSVRRAATALGVNNGNLSSVFNQENLTKMLTGADGKCYTGTWFSDHTDLEGEEWKTYWRSKKKALRISNHGRIQWGYPGRWGHMHFPESSNAKGYLMVRFDGSEKCVHVLVGELFYEGHYPLGWVEWDHKDLDKQNNHILNLNPVTREVNRINTARQRDFFLWKADDPDDWVRCVSQIGTARAYNLNTWDLNSVLHKRVKKNGQGYEHVLKTVNGYCAAWCDEVDEVS